MASVEWSVLLRPTVKAILGSLLDGPRSLTDLSSATGLTKPALQRHLRDVEALGVVAREIRAAGRTREVVYRLIGGVLHLEIRPPGPSRPGLVLSWASPGEGSDAFPLLAQVRDPLDREDVGRALRSLRSAARSDWATLVVIVFGSIATGEASRKSDIDIMIVLPSDNAALRERLADALARAQPEVARPIQPFFTTRAAFLAAERSMDRAAARSGIILQAPAEESDVWRSMTRYRSISV